MIGLLIVIVFSGITYFIVSLIANDPTNSDDTPMLFAGIVAVLTIAFLGL